MKERNIRDSIDVERRCSPRIQIENEVQLSISKTEAKVVNLGEGGLCFECKENEFKDEISLIINFPSSKEYSKITGKIVWSREIEDRNRFRVGVSFISLDKKEFLKIRELIFNAFIRRVLIIVKEDNKNLKLMIKEFFNKSVKKYYESLSELAKEIDINQITQEDADRKFILLTDNFLSKGERFEKNVGSNIYMKKIKEAFREIVGCWVYKSPIVKMAYDKPRGYPGDYKLFEIIYNNKPMLTADGIGLCSEKYFLNSGYTKAVRTRKNKMKNILQDFIENTNLSSVRLFNVACGPSREIRELLYDPIFSSRREIIFTGLDNDEKALEFSRMHLENLPDNIKLRFLHENVLNIFRDDKYYDTIGKQDIIYILGLTEYLPDRIFKRLMRFLSEILDVGGMLVITYKDKNVTFPSLPPDWFCGWAFIKRSKEDLINAATELGADKFHLKIEKEGTESIFFLILTKING